MKRKQSKIDIVDFNKKIIKEKLKNSLYILSDLDKEFLNVKYKSEFFNVKYKSKKKRNK